MEYVTRDEAILRGDKFFFLGSACKNGHVDKRFVSNYSCYMCSKTRYYATLKTEKYKDARSRQSKREYAKNRNRYYLNNAKRRGREKRATPTWLTDNHISIMLNFYKGRPEGFHVDHIVPLCGKNVCGLNVPWNLQYLPKHDNLSKGNQL